VDNFTRKEVHCDPEEFAKVHQEATELIFKMKELQTFEEIKFAQVQVCTTLTELIPR
jgi:hypothetical protein